MREYVREGDVVVVTEYARLARSVRDLLSIVDELTAKGVQLRSVKEQFFNRNIEAVLEQFVSRRLEGIALQYFHRAAMRGLYPDIDDFGSYWYDDPATKTNGEFDCVIRHGEKYDFYECKYFDHPMTLEECSQEKVQLDSIKGITVSGVGFVCTGGFDFANADDFELIDGKTLYFNK